MKKQKEIFLSSEGNAWYQRNKQAIENKETDCIINCISELNLLPKNILEIGCSNGYRLNELNKKYSSNCFGVDPSLEAIDEGKLFFDKISLSQGTADSLDFNDNKFDLVILGFCLYVCDRNDLFKIASEVDRVLSDKGFIIILDFGPPFPYKNNYKYMDGVFSYKMDYSALFKWNPNYFMIYSRILAHEIFSSIYNPNERVLLSILSKDANSGYPNNPFSNI
ncbi:MAG: class I SAM-dependent methyltransferase [Patescibacteria group bacterium]